MKGWNRFEKIAFVAFLFWSAAGLIFTFFRITPEMVAGWPVPHGLRGFVDLCLRTGDPLLIVLAFANTHLHAARQWGPAAARHWGLIVVVISLAVETLGAWTGFPFGLYTYTDRFGPLLGLVPLTIPLAWHVVVTNSLFLVRGRAPHRSRGEEAVFTGLLGTFYDFILEPFATRVRHYWTWSGNVIPLQNYVAWFVLSGLIVRLFSPTLATRFPRDLRPATILALTIVIFAIGRWTG